MPNRVVWTAEATRELSVAIHSHGPAEVAQLISALEHKCLRPGHGRPDQDAQLVMCVEQLSAVYHLIGAGTAIEVLEVRRKGQG